MYYNISILVCGAGYTLEHSLYCVYYHNSTFPLFSACNMHTGIVVFFLSSFN